MNAESLYAALERYIVAAGRDPAQASRHDWYEATAALVRSLVASRWVESRREQTAWHSKRVCYLSMEFLLGRLLRDSLRNLGILDVCCAALAKAGHSLEDVEAEEADPGLGSGGLGRLAACLMDSLATVGIPAYGYGMRFELGLFSQMIRDGWQHEQPDRWLSRDYAWEFDRPELTYRITSGARDGASDVLAHAFDIPVLGYASDCVNTLRLWWSEAANDFDSTRFQDGDHIGALSQRVDGRNLTRVLYPNDGNDAGRRLRFRQEHFFVSASVQDILAQYCASHGSLDQLPEKVAIQINDTHPALVIPELMRLLVDCHGLPWERAWDITRNTVTYTNHTLMPEALETWPVHFFESMLPRHLDIIYRINHDFLSDVRQRHPGDSELARRLSLVGEHGERHVRMAHLSFVGSRRINGVSEVHTDLMRRTLFADLLRAQPGKVVNVTNGVTPRRWLADTNPNLAALITSRIGNGWMTDAEELQKLVPHADDPEFRRMFRAIKATNKRRLAQHVATRCGVSVSSDSLFDVHVKRIHEYKRQLLKLLHGVALYDRIRRGHGAGQLPRTVLFAGKAAPGYAMAKLIIKLINDVADKVNRDPAVGDLLKVVFLPNYGVSEAQIIIPAADLSEQISLAGTEASGTGNMKFALNGALTIGTMDGANIEIAGAVGPENFFAFGMTVEEIETLRAAGYSPRHVYSNNEELRHAIDLIADGFFSPEEPRRFAAIVDSLLGHDPYCLLADFGFYIARQAEVERAYRDIESWSRRAILNVARIGYLSSDRAIRDYARQVWECMPSHRATQMSLVGA